MKKKELLKIKILVYNKNTSYKINKRLYKKVAKHVLNAINYKLDVAEISLVLADDDFLRQLNKKYNNVDSSTDVLTFPMNDSEDIDDPLLGDIIISIPTAEKQAYELGHSLDYELIFLFIHGILHLLGLHHEQSKEMEEKVFSLQGMLMEEFFNGR